MTYYGQRSSGLMIEKKINKIFVWYEFGIPPGLEKNHGLL
jgi:hypothetical protein